MISPDLVCRRVFPKDATRIARSVNSVEWDEKNELSDFEENLLYEFLSDEDNVLIVAEKEGEVVGMVQAYILRKPSKGSNWLYIDEVDVKPGHRKQGIGSSLMTTILEISNKLGIESWLGTEIDNEAASALYESLKPTEIEKFVGYTYKPKKTVK